MASITKTGGALRWALDHHQSDREVVMAAVRRSGLALAFVSDRLQLDVEVAMTAVRQDGKALYFVPAELKASVDIQVAAIAQTSDAIHYVPSRDAIAEHIREALGLFLTLTLLKVYPQPPRTVDGRRVVMSTRFGSAATMRIAQFAGAPTLKTIGQFRAARANLA